MKQKHFSAGGDAHENRLIRRDLNFVIVLNLALLVLLLGAYMVNGSSGLVDRLFSGIVRF